MKQSEKTKRTKDRILNAAIAEFGTKTYECASLNTICNDNQIPKGLIYHNFKNKDELYLQCVRLCYEEMTAFLSDSSYQTDNMHDNLQNLLRRRQEFFQKNPYYSNIFFNTVLMPPRHLLQEIGEIRKSFDEFHISCYKKLLEQIPLREGVTCEMALEYFMIFQETFNNYFQKKSYEMNDFNTMIQDHELKLSKVFDLMLYGIAKEEKQK